MKNRRIQKRMVSPATRMERSILNPIPQTLNTRRKPHGLERILHIWDHVEHVGSFKYWGDGMMLAVNLSIIQTLELLLMRRFRCRIQSLEPPSMFIEFAGSGAGIGSQ